MMNDNEIRRRVRSAIDECSANADASPSLRGAIMQKIEGEEPMAKKISFTAIVAIALLVLSMTAALAAALRGWGIVDFAGELADTYIPANTEDSITVENIFIETQSVKCVITESYYDGVKLIIVAQITPKTDTLLIDSLMGADTSMGTLTHHIARDDDSEGENETVAEYALNKLDGRIAMVELSVDEAFMGSASDLIMNADGTYTTYIECRFNENAPEAEVPFKLLYIPCAIDASGDGEYELNYDFEEAEAKLLTHVFTAVPTRCYISKAPMDFPGAGVRVTRVEMTVSPLEISYELDYEVVDLDTYNATDEGLWFEFVVPESAEMPTSLKRLIGGISSAGFVLRLDGNNDLPPEAGTAFRQINTIGLSGLSNQYTLRAFNAWDKTLYETATFEVEEE